MKVTIKTITAPLRAPFVSASGSISSRELILLTLEDAEGHRAVGEAAPLEPYDGVSVTEVLAALEDCRGTLMRAGWLERGELLAECSRLAVLPQAVAAIDLALWDLEGRRADQPVWRLLGAGRDDPLEVNYTIAAPDRTTAATEASAARAAGFQALKLKVGLGDDAGRLAAVRAAAGTPMSIRIDANGAWSLEQAASALRALKPAGIELCEDPVPEPDQIRSLSAMTDVPLSIDESAAAPGVLDQRACQAICLKIARCGGITGTIAAARRAREAGYEVYLASTLDGPLGIAAALHAAAVLRPQRPCGLATLPLFAARDDPLPAHRGRIRLPPGPGLGAGLLSWYGERG